MQFSGKITTEDLADARKLVRSKARWPKILLRNWYVVLFAGGLIWTTISGLAGSSRPDWWATGLIWCGVLGLATKVSYRVKGSAARQLARMQGILPDSIGFTEEGVQLKGPSGATAFQPWGNFKGWREGQRVILLERGRGRSVIFPVGNLSDAVRQPIRRFLQSHISPQSVNP